MISFDLGTARLRQWIRPLARMWVEELQQAAADVMDRVMPARRQRLELAVADGQWILRTEKHGEGLVADSLGFSTTVPDRDRLRATLAASNIPAQRVSVVLSDEKVLRRQLRLPASIGSALGSAVALQLPRLFPLRADTIVHDYRVLEPESTTETLTIEIAAVRRDLIEGIVIALHECGLAVDQIVLRDASGQSRHRFLSARLRRALTPGAAWSPTEKRLGVSAVALALAVAAVPFVQMQRERAAWAETLAAADAASIGAVKASETLVSLLNPAQAIVDLSTAPTAGQAMATLSVALPTDSWLAQYEWQPGSVRVRSLTPDASKLIDELSAAPLASTTRLVSATPASGIPGMEDVQLEVSAELPQ